jgi:hypothetical protein
VVLRVEKSVDFYVAVSAKYSRSCYGMSLQELVHTLQPVATTLLPVERFRVGEDGEIAAVPISDPAAAGNVHSCSLQLFVGTVSVVAIFERRTVHILNCGIAG